MPSAFSHLLMLNVYACLVCSGCGFVVFASKESADEALAAVADKARLPGSVRELIVRYAGPRPEETGE